MKKLTALLILVVALVATTGCVSTKKIRYFQGADTLYAQAQRIMQQYEMRLKPADQVYIKATCSEPELLDVFSQGVILGSTGRSGGGNVSGSGTLSNINGFTVDNQGFISLPHIGKLHVMDMTTEECARLVEEKIRENGIATDPEVQVYLLNARVTVLGAVGAPRVVSLTSERNTIVDILAQCGDIGDTGLRYKIRLFREENGMRQMYFLDMTKADVFQSPAFYVQQNDLIYVEHNKSKGVKASPLYTFMGAGSSILAAIMSVISFIFVFKK